MDNTRNTVTPDMFGDHLAKGKQGTYLEHLAALWASENTSLRRIYLNYGFDEDLGMDVPYCIGHRNRITNLLGQGWESFDLDHWSSDPEALLAGLYILSDGLPGVLDDDVDLFAQ